MVLVTTAGEVGAEAALLLSRQDGTSRVTAGIDLSDIRGLDRVPELPLRPEHALGEETREHRRTQTRQEQSSLAGPAEDERESR
jgi:hypothetical protein